MIIQGGRLPRYARDVSEKAEVTRFRLIKYAALNTPITTGAANTPIRRDVHQLSAQAATIPAKASAELRAPPGRRIGSEANSSGEIPRREPMCAASATSQAAKPPNRAEPNIHKYAFWGAKYWSTTATAIPPLDATRAARGEPAWVRRAKDAGAYPPRARENKVREATYRLPFAPESAAVNTTKFMTSEARGTPMNVSTVTNGLCATPAWLHGIMPTSTTMAPR